jgi:cytoskeletal protein CcmA (bactofilin family)
MARQSNGSAPKKVSIISEGTTFEGTLVSSSDMRISGYVKGSVETAGKLVVPESGYIEGSVKGGSLDIAGRIKGSINVSGSLLLKRTAIVDANIQLGRLMVEEGAIFNGECRTGDRIIDTSEIPATAAAKGTGNSEPARE